MACCLLARGCPSSQSIRAGHRSGAVKQGGSSHPRVRPLRTARQTSSEIKAGPSDVMLLDFDGVIVDSEPEEAFIQDNKLYAGIADAVSQCQYPWYVITSRAKDRTLKLLKGLLCQDWPEDTPRLYAGLSPPNEKKIAAIRDIAQRPLVADSKARLHFVDDRFETVQAVLEAPDLRETKLKVYLADWGYNTEDERQAAQKIPGLLTINLKQFAELLQWGVVMGVDDGCGDDN